MPRIEPLRSFHQPSLGHQLSLEDNGKTVKRIKQNPLGPSCVALGCQQLGNFAEGRYAEFIVSYNGKRATMSDYQGGGLVFGVTRTRPGYGGFKDKRKRHTEETIKEYIEKVKEKQMMMGGGDNNSEGVTGQEDGSNNLLDESGNIISIPKVGDLIEGKEFQTASGYHENADPNKSDSNNENITEENQGGGENDESQNPTTDIDELIPDLDPDTLQGRFRSALHVPDSWIIDVYGSLWRRPPLPGEKDIIEQDTNKIIKDSSKIHIYHPVTGDELLTNPNIVGNIGWSPAEMGDPKSGPAADFMEVNKTSCIAESWKLNARDEEGELLTKLVKEVEGRCIDNWDSYALLKDRDSIGVLIRPDAEMKVYLNGNNVGNLMLDEKEISVTNELYLVVELQGRCEGVTINDRAKAPEIPVKDED